MEKNTLAKSLMAPEPIAKYDIFRNYKANNEDPSIWKPQPKPKDVQEVKVDPLIISQLQSGEKVKTMPGFASITRNDGLVSLANDRIRLVVDVTKCMADHNYTGAELLLGRKLTVDEINAQLVKDFSAQPLTEVEKAKREIRREELKAKIIAETKAQEEIAKRYKDIRLAAEEAKKRVAAGEQMDAVLKQLAGEFELKNQESALLNILSMDDPTFEDIDRLLMEDPPVPRLDVEDDDLESIATTVVDRGNTMREGMSLMDDPRSHAELETKYDDVEEPPEDDVESIAPTEAAMEQKEEPKKKYNDNDLDIHYHPDEIYTMKTLKQLCQQLSHDHPEVKPMLKGFNQYQKKDMAELRQKIEAAIKYIDEVKYPPLEPQPLAGHGLFPEKTKLRNLHHFVKFGRYAINKHKLDTQSLFSLVHPMGGKAGIPNSVLTAALKSIVEKYIAGEPYDDKDLTHDEKDWKDSVWHQAHITKKPPKLKVRKLTTKKEILDRIDVLIGEIAAENDSELILKELAALVKTAEIKKWLPAEEIIKIKKFLRDIE